MTFRGRHPAEIPQGNPQMFHRGRGNLHETKLAPERNVILRLMVSPGNAIFGSPVLSKAPLPPYHSN